MYNYRIQYKLIYLLKKEICIYDVYIYMFMYMYIIYTFIYIHIYKYLQKEKITKLHILYFRIVIYYL